VAALFAEGFRVLQERHAGILVGLRQLGLMMGIEMAHEQCGPLFSKVAFDHGLLSVYANNDPRVAQLLPPLIIDRALTLEILDRVDQSLLVIKTIFRGRRDDA
jgi:acetylornithine/succinyldiaminopimelate/putrescine aminotransferase